VWQDTLSVLVLGGGRALACLHLRRTGRSAFVTCSTPTITTSRRPTRGRRDRRRELFSLPRVLCESESSVSVFFNEDALLIMELTWALAIQKDWPP
jgi:hypothetical protein